MPIAISTPLRCLSQDDFHAVDRLVLGHAFKIHNQYGGLLDEAVYKTLLAERCAKDGMPALREVRVDATHRTFTKSYFIDLLVDGSTIVEVKTAKALTLAHRGQGVNYLLLAGTQHGSLINFRGAKAEREFLSTRLLPKDRQSFDTVAVNWPADAVHDQLRSAVAGLCADIGLGLDVGFYREAVATLLTLPRVSIAVLSGTAVAGHHEMTMLAPNVALVVTSRAKSNSYRPHLARLLSNTLLEGLTWINLTLGHIHLEHISQSSLRS